MDSKRHRWTITDYRLGSIALTTEYLAVYAEDPGEDGTCSLVTYPIVGFCTARVVEREVEGYKGEAYDRVLSTEVRSEIVAVELCDGAIDVCQELSNFGGIIKVGHVPTDADVPYLNRREYPVTKEDVKYAKGE